MMRLPLLTFHSIDPSESVISFPADGLRALLSRLARAGWQGTSLSEAVSAAAEPRRLGIAFDDGYRNVIDAALPVLRELGFTATVFVVAGHVGGRSDWGPAGQAVPELPLLGWDEIEALAAAGWEVGAHGVRHRWLPATAPDQLRREVEESAEIIGARLGSSPALFAYPYGGVTDPVRAAVREVYAGAVGTRLDYVRPTDLADPYALPRLDAYYLRGPAGSWSLDGAAMRGYLRLRRTLRSLRRDRDHRLYSTA